jgi:DNA-binding protein WhiA
VKEGAAIVDLLNIMGAHVSLMKLENLRIEKEMRNSINRQVNCETANITKIVNASSKQIEDIRLIQNRMGFSGLPENLREMAIVRLSHPESSLQELGGYLNPPVGKSGVNHRLRKLSEIADKIRS